MGKRVIITALFVSCLMIPFLTHAEIYKWIDEKGTVHFTDNYTIIPASYTEQRKVEIRQDIREEEAPLGPQEIISKSKEQQTDADLYREEEAWKEKVRPWMEQLEQATANYEIAHKKFIEKSEELGRRRFGSPTMYKFDIIRLDQLNEERLKHKAQIEEADQMLRKLSRPYSEEAPSIMKEGKATDIYGIGEDWWKERVRPLKERLEGLNVRYKNAEKEFIAKASDLSKRRYGNRHTIKAKVIQLDESDKEVLKYQAQIAETEEVLERISRDAQESEADPDWLK